MSRSTRLVADPFRRRLLLASAGLGGLSLLGQSPRVLAAPVLAASPFTLGVASGDPLTDGFVIWTRLAPLPLQGGGMPDAAVEVLWEVASDERLQKPLRSGVAIADPAWGHSVHVEVEGLAPGRPYWYRFRLGDHVSPVGRALTAPVQGKPLDQLKLAYASCQHFEQGYFVAYRQIVADDPDLILHLGDYIYESSWGAAVRRHEGPEPVTLAEYRNRHARYKLDIDLQRAHAHCPWLVTWDDHEVDNDYAAGHGENFDPGEAFLLRRAAAYQAYWEHMPLRLRSRPVGPDMQLFQSNTFGDLIAIQVLDNRQYRSDQACPSEDEGGGQVIDQCPARVAPEQTMLGPLQERWLLAGLDRSEARWNLIAQQMLMAELRQKDRAGAPGFWTDGWDGYPAGRARIIQHLASRKIANPLVIGGDIHSFWATDLKLDFADPSSATVATEFVGTSISSSGVPYEPFKAFASESPHIHFFESRQRGYVSCRVTPDRVETDFVVVDDVRNPESGSRRLKRFVTEAGRPGVQEA